MIISDEHMRFLEAIQKYGRDWKKVQSHVGTRSSTQSRSHAQKFFKKIGIDKVGYELRKLKSGASTGPEFAVDLDADKPEERKHYDSDAESEIKIWIDFWQTPYPRLRDPLPFCDDDDDGKHSSNDDEMKSEAEHDEALQMPDSPQKSRANSEKSINKKKLCSTKEASDMSNTTQCSSGKHRQSDFVVVKSKASKPAAFDSNDKRPEPAAAAVDDGADEQPDAKELEFRDNKQDEPAALLKESNHSFVLDNLNLNHALLASVESHDFMDHPHKVLERPKDSKGHFESEDRHHYDFEMEHNEYIGEYSHIHQKQLNSSIGDRFEFEEGHDNDHDLHGGLFLNEGFMNHPRQFD